MNTLRRSERSWSTWRVTAFLGVVVAAGVVAFGVNSAVSYFGDSCTARDEAVIGHVPQYPGATLEWRRPLPDYGPRYCQAYLDTGDSPREVWRFYRRGLRQRGWRVSPLGADGSGVYGQRLTGDEVWTISISDFGDRFYLVLPDDASPDPDFRWGSTGP